MIYQDIALKIKHAMLGILWEFALIFCIIYTLKKITGIKTAKSGSKVNVSWKNINGETGCQISVSANKKGTDVVSTYKTTKGNSKVLSVQKGKKLYYKVRAYKVIGDKKVYGPWSEVKSFKRT